MAHFVGSVRVHELGEDMLLINDRVAQSSVRVIDEGGSPLWHPSGIILVTTGLERLAFYCIICNLPAFLGTNHHPVTLGLSSETIALTVLLFSQLPYFFAFVGGTLADTRWGRYKVYFAGLVLQLLGSLLMLLSAVLEQPHVRASSSDEDRLLQSLVFLGQTCLALGIACSSGTEIPLGVDQYREDGGPAMSIHFFPRYYFVVNVAATLAFTVLSFVQMNYGFAIGLAPSSVAYVAAIIFLFRRRHGLTKLSPIQKRDGSSPGLRIDNICAVLKHAWRTRTKASAYERLSGEERSKTEGALRQDAVKELRRLCRVVVVLLSLTLYMASETQTRTDYVQQGKLMRSPLDRTTGLQIPSSMFVAFNSASILIFTPVLHGIVFPKIRDSSFPYNITSLRRIGIGMVVSLGSLLAAFLVEYYRRKTPEFQIKEELSGDNLTVSDMSIFYQIPQYALSGVAEVLVFIAALEFACFKSPRSMRGFAMGLVYSVLGLGGLLSYSIGLIAAASDKHLRYQKNVSTYGAMHYFYAIMMVVMVIGIGIFTIVAYRFKEEPPRTADVSNTQ